MTTLILITHAHTAQEPAVDARQWALSTVGVRQAAALAAQPFWPGVDMVALSSELKTRLTVEPVLRQYGFPVCVDARFDELQRTGWHAGYAAHVAQVFARPTASIGGWEPAAAALARFRAGVAALVGRGTTVALVSHGLVLSLYRAALLGRQHVDVSAWQALPFAGVAIVDPARKRLVQDFAAVVDGGPGR